MTFAKTLIEITLATLREHPDDWVVDRFKATNEKLGIEVWIANSYYGLKIRGPGLTTGEESAPFTGWLTPWRRRVMKAVREVGSRELLRRFAEHYPEAAKRLLPSPTPSGSDARGRG